MNDQMLFEYYRILREPEANEWNLSPRSLYLEYVTRDYVSNNFNIFEGMKVCNVGIGVGEWDDYLGYLLKGKGQLTSIDIDPYICKMFQYRQLREGHPNPSFVVCESILKTTVKESQFDLLTMIGSTLKETQKYEEAFKKCLNLINENGSLMYMDFEKYHASKDFEAFALDNGLHIVQKDVYDKYENLTFYIYKVKK